jgi:hypothetical protein
VEVRSARRTAVAGEPNQLPLNDNVANVYYGTIGGQVDVARDGFVSMSNHHPVFVKISVIVV